MILLENSLRSLSSVFQRCLYCPCDWWPLLDQLQNHYFIINKIGSNFVLINKVLMENASFNARLVGNGLALPIELHVVYYIKLYEK